MKQVATDWIPVLTKTRNDLKLQNFCYSNIFGQIWSDNLKFYKMTEISYKGKLLYAYYDFDVYSFKIFVSHIFLDKFGPKI